MSLTMVKDDKSILTDKSYCATNYIYIAYGLYLVYV